MLSTCDLEDDAFSTAQTCLDAYGIQKSRTDPHAAVREDPERQDLTLFAQVSRQSEPGGRLVPKRFGRKIRRCLISRRSPRIPWILGKHARCKQRHGPAMKQDICSRRRLIGQLIGPVSKR
jgi:hypothetical protein